MSLDILNQKVKKTLFTIKNMVNKFFYFLSSFKKNKQVKINRQKQVDLDKKLVYSLSKSRIPNLRQLKYLKRFLSPKEIWIIRICMAVIVANILYGASMFYIRNLKIVPVEGGKYTEALIGSPKHINPLYSSINDADNDLDLLIYSSLFQRGKNSNLVNDLVENYSISDDGRIYVFEIKNNAKWHDGNKLTADDVIFTFNAIKDPLYKSPLKQSFDGVEIEKLEEYKFQFLLSEPYAAFLELLTFGIMPANLWSQISPESATLAELNLKPIGSGPYKFEKLAKDKMGNIREYYLIINEDYYNQKPLIDLKFVFYSNFEEAIAAINNNEAEGISYLPPEYKQEILTPKAFNFYKLYIPQLTLLYLNQSKNPALGDKSVRQALAYAVDRNKIINDILLGDAYAVHGPILPNSFAYYQDIKKYGYLPEKAKELLESVDWKTIEISEDDIIKAQEDLESEDEELKTEAANTMTMGAGQWRQKNNNFLVLKITTVDRNKNEEVIKAVAQAWEEIGIKTVIEVLPIATIQKEVIIPRNYEVLFYGQVLGADPDPYAFWHSSQTGEGGFNIANFVNKDADQLLEDARLILDQNQRKEKYIEFQKIISEETPVIFMYSPVYTYMLTNDIKGYEIHDILYPRDRYSNITEWYIKTGKRLVWPKD